MFNQNYSIIAFVKETDGGVSFPFLPEQIWDESYDIYCINCDTASPIASTCAGNCDETIHISSYEIAKHGGVANIIASLIHSDNMERRRIFTVHPNNILLPIYRWYLLKHGTAISSVDEYVQRLSRVTVDICEAFHKPTILTLDRRQNFNYKTIARWLDLTPQGESKTEQCLSTLKYICQRL
jgi:hypothetical protein